MSIRLPLTVMSEDAPLPMDAQAPVAHEFEPERRVVDSVARLTLHRDIDALDHSLTLSLAELLRARLVLLYKCMSAEACTESLVSCRQTPAGHYEVRPSDLVESMSAYPQLMDCANSQDSGHLAGDDGLYMIWTPIRMDGHVVGVLLVEGHDSFDTMFPVLDGFCRIYSNYVGLIHEAECDKLTGLLNRSTIDRYLQRLVGRVSRVSTAAASEQLWLAILDIDHFKRVNDTYGHLYGDEVILWVAQQLRANFPSPNALFRFGGEEFVALVVTPEEGGIHAMLEQFRARMADYIFPQIGAVTVSIGFVRVTGAGFSTAVLDLADKALYYAKNHGRNQVRGYHDLVAAGLLAGDVMVGSVDLF